MMRDMGSSDGDVEGVLYHEDTEDLISYAEAARILGISRERVRQLTAQGKLVRGKRLGVTRASVAILDVERRASQQPDAPGPIEREWANSCIKADLWATNTIEYAVLSGVAGGLSVNQMASILHVGPGTITDTLRWIKRVPGAPQMSPPLIDAILEQIHSAAN
jgi:hypothetical protein